MTPFDRLASEVESFVSRAERLGRLQRRHDRISTAFNHLCKDVSAAHAVAQPAAVQLARLRGLDRQLQQIDREMLDLIRLLHVASAEPSA